MDGPAARRAGGNAGRAGGVHTSFASKRAGRHTHSLFYGRQLTPVERQDEEVRPLAGLAVAAALAKHSRSH